VTDPSTALNPCRAIHQAFDEGLADLQELLKIQGKGKDARDFEKPIAWLLWMLGFSVTHLDSIPRGNGAPDLVARTLKGNFMVIECTTGILKADHKLPNVVARAEKVKQKLADSGHKNLKVLPVLVTNRTREEVKVDAEHAEKSGVLIVTREDFTELIRLTEFPQDPDAFYDRAEQKLASLSRPNPFTPWGS
jgi:Holliday junction resolvase